MVKKNIESGKHASAHLESVRNLDTWPFPQLLIMLIDVELLSSGTSTPFPNTAPALRDQHLLQNKCYRRFKLSFEWIH